MKKVKDPIFLPEQFLERVLSERFYNKTLLVDGKEFKKTELLAILRSTAVSKRKLKKSILKVLQEYEAKAEKLKKEKVKSFRKEAVNGEKLLRSRLENLILYTEVEKIKEEHEGEYYRWLPSSADEADPEHQMLYGRIFRAGAKGRRGGDKDGLMPGQRYGCRCGIQWLTKKEADKIKKDMKANEKVI